MWDEGARVKELYAPPLHTYLCPFIFTYSSVIDFPGLISNKALDLRWNQFTSNPGPLGPGQGLATPTKGLCFKIVSWDRIRK